jgi:hypothetical protein
MAEGKNQRLWNHTALLAAKIHNAFCMKKSDLRNFEDFHPYMKRKKAEPPMARNTGDLLIATFCKRDR